MNQARNAYPDPSGYAEQLLRTNEQLLSNAVAIVNPEQPEANPLDVFVAPAEVRSEAQDPGYTYEQEQALRAVAAEFGFGRETDLTVSELGLNGAHVVIEGGLPHKIMAEIKTITNDKTAQPASYILAGSPYRKATSEAEINSAKAQFNGQYGETELDNVRLAASTIEGFRAQEGGDQVLPFGYTVDSVHDLLNKPTGQFSLVGYVGEAPVVLMRIDREDYQDEAGQNKYRYQPDTATVIGLVSQVLSTTDETSPVALVTSSAYQTSRQIDATRAALSTSRPVGVASYGTKTLATVKNEQISAPVSINQLPGELYKIAQNIESLRQELQQ